MNETIQPQIRYRVEITSIEMVDRPRREWRQVRTRPENQTPEERRTFVEFEYIDDVWPVEVRRTILLQEVETYLPLAQVIAAVNSFDLAETTAPEVR